MGYLAASEESDEARRQARYVPDEKEEAKIPRNCPTATDEL